MNIEVYAEGLVALSACASAGMAPADVEAEVNTFFPTGLSSPWALSPDPTFKSGQPNPCPCDMGTGRIHYLFQC